MGAMETGIYKEALEAELATITEELKGLGVHNPQNAEDWVATPVGTEQGEADENVAADRAEELEERSSILADLETRYNAINRALARISAGTYGVCEVGGEAIEAERLAANPAARTCIAHREEEGALPA
jgi:DnaK suppressor protein